jgi:hypothetical protein
VHVSARPKPTYFFNDDLRPLIEMVGGLDHYVNILTIPKTYIKRYNVILNQTQIQQLLDLSQL